MCRLQTVQICISLWQNCFSQDFQAYILLLSLHHIFQSWCGWFWTNDLLGNYCFMTQSGNLGWDWEPGEAFGGTLRFLVYLIWMYGIWRQNWAAAAAAAKWLQLCPTPCDPIDGSLPGSPVPGILQARILEWAAISFSSVWKWKVKGKSLSRVRLLATPWTAAYQAPASMGFSRQEYWSGVLLPSPGRKWRGTQKPLDESESGEWKSWLKAQHSEKRRSWHPVPSLQGK